MGKWAPDYIDDVLHSKIKNLVSGAITRSALEKTEPTITYEDFVHDLETGDSFTTSLVEVLVKELAERRIRPNVNDDRRLIAERSAKSLRQLAAHRIYRDHSGRYIPRRRSATLTDYLSAPPMEMDMDEDEDIFERMLENGTSIIEGVRINSDLYDAYGAGHSSIPVSTPSPPAEEVTSPPPPPLPHTHFRSGPWSITNGSGPSVLTRQPSLRRFARSARTVDFNEFTHRRRSSTRENQSSRGENNEAQEHWDSRHSHPTRRFFPFVRTRRSDPHDSWPPSDPLSPDAPASHESGEMIYPAEASNAPWFNLTPPVHRDAPTMEEVLAEAETSDERAHAGPAPRLRRGGLRAPESILPRHSSPIPLANSREPPYADTIAAVEPPPERAREPTREEAQSPAEPSGYPTPGSTEHEFFA